MSSFAIIFFLTVFSLLKEKHDDILKSKQKKIILLDDHYLIVDYHEDNATMIYQEENITKMTINLNDVWQPN